MARFKDQFNGHKSGFVTIIGAPNVGKSTLLNRMLGQKISITSQKPQTTRNRILGVLHRPNAQLVFIDTPGIHKAQKPLNMRIVDAALAALGEGDLLLVMIDVATADTESEIILLKALQKQSKPTVLALNKIDLVNKSILLTYIDHWKNKFSFKAIIPISAKQGDQIDVLINAMEEALPFGPPYFPEDSLTDQPERFIAAEIIREKVFRLTGQEIPYSTAVTIDSFTEKNKVRLNIIHATIHLERDSQKGIVIGKGGKKLKEIGKAARFEIERLIGTQIFLKLFVHIEKNWSKDTKALRRFGY